MKITLLILAALALIIVAALLVLGQLSRNGNAPGLADGRLRPCPDSDNCVCSEYPEDSEHYVEPISNESGARYLQQAIHELGGKIETNAVTYIAASFRSPLFGFIDDFEIRIDNARGLLHLRSAARVGRGDMNVNRERVQRFRRLLAEKSG